MIGVLYGWIFGKRRTSRQEQHFARLMIGGSITITTRKGK